MNDTSARSSEYAEALRLAVESLTDEGWDVEVQPIRLPEELGKFRPDYIARRGDELIIGEVKFRGERELVSLEHLSQLVDQIPRARLEMTWLGRAVEPPTGDDVVKMSEAAVGLIPTNAAAAMLFAWSSLEGALELYAEVDAGSTYRRRPSDAYGMLNSMANLGDLSKAQFDRLYRASKQRNAIAHGEYLQPPSDLIEYVATVAKAIVRGGFATVEEMVEWFLENYKDLADKVSFESQESEHRLILDHSSSVSTVLEVHFDMMPRQDVEEAAVQIGQVGNDWVRRDDD